MTGDDIVTAARNALETPFVHQGRVVGKAMDCAGLIIHVAKTLELDHIDQSGYSRTPSGGLLEASLGVQPCLIEVDAPPIPGDVLLMRFSGAPQHLAICAGSTIIHAWQIVGKVCEHSLTDVWRARIVKVYRFSGVVNG